MSQTAKQVELGILGSLATLSPRSAAEAIQRHQIGHSLFMSPGTNQLFDAIRNLIAQGGRSHPVVLARTVSADVQRAIGGSEVLAQVCDPDWVDKQPALPLLVDDARRRQAHARARTLIEKMSGHLLRNEPEAVRDCARQLLEEPAADGNEVFHIAEVCSQIQLDAEQRVDGKAESAQLSTGVPTLDRALGGGFPHNLVVIGAEGGRGKSGLAIRMAKAMADGAMPVGYITLEDAAATLVTRLINEHPAVSVRDPAGASFPARNWLP